jgi:hypothetical protein
VGLPAPPLITRLQARLSSLSLPHREPLHSWLEDIFLGIGGVTITALDNGETLLTGAVIDQAALHGLLTKVRDIGLPLVSIECVKAGATQAEKVNEAHQARSEEEI